MTKYTQGFQKDGVKWIKSIFELEGMVEQGLGPIFITTCSSPFFNQIDSK